MASRFKVGRLDLMSHSPFTHPAPPHHYHHHRRPELPPHFPTQPPAEASGKQNIAFVCQFLLGRLDECIDLLVGCGRLPEAAFFARTYAPSRMTEVRSWVCGWGVCVFVSVCVWWWGWGGVGC